MTSEQLSLSMAHIPFSFFYHFPVKSKQEMEETGFPDIKNLIREEPYYTRRLKAFQRDSRKRTRVRAAKKSPFGLAFLPSTLYSVEALRR